MASVRHAAFQDARLSMLAARRGIMPESGNAGVSSWVVHSAVGFCSCPADGPISGLPIWTRQRGPASWPASWRDR